MGRLSVNNFLIVLLVIGAIVGSCEHEPVAPTEIIILPDTTGNPNPNPGPIVNPGPALKPCDPDTVYFRTQILPIFISNCAISGCHDRASAQEGVILTDYINITKEIVPFDLEFSEAYEKITEDRPERLMPRDPLTNLGFSLPQEQIGLIASWIKQGAIDNTCDDCDSTVFTYADRVEPLITQNCATSVSCHGSGSGNGDYTSYGGLKAKVDIGAFELRVLRNLNMPPAAPLPECDRIILQKWLDDGALNN